MHRLLERQIKRFLGASATPSPELAAFLAAVDEAYQSADAERLMIERSLDLMSQELIETNGDLRRQLAEKQDVELALRTSKDRLARAQQISRLGNWEWDVVENKLFWSDEIYRIFDVIPQEVDLNYEVFIGFVHPDDRPQVERMIAESLDKRIPFSLEHRIVLADGSIKFLHERGEVQADDSGQVVKTFGTVHDITERKLVEELLLREKQEQSLLIKKLEEAHNQLLQSEKMASIGQLAAGVAHEINNPIGYVSSNLGTLRVYLDQLLLVLDAYERAEQACEPTELARVKALKKEVELDFLKEDILDLLQESGEGIKRVKQIVQDLKDFSHVDEAEWQLADLHSGLDSTLNVVNNEIKYKADVVKEYGDIPRVECLPSQINQVLMNLLVNAAHAMGEDKRGLITVRTGADGEEVWVEIADTGKGIPPENITRIFDPFFTTKPVGKGTGLGLSLSYGIVEKHHGRIEVNSEGGRGTTFRVTLPVTNARSEEKVQN